MRLILPIFAALITIGTNVRAETQDKQYAWKMMIDAAAAQMLCPAIEINPDGLEAMRRQYGLVEGDENYPELHAAMKATLAAYQSHTVEEICMGSLFIYGPNGITFPDLVRRKK